MEMNIQKSLGTCPVCGRGEVVNKGLDGYGCTMCGDFHIHMNIKGAEITPEMVRQLIEKGTTDFIRFYSYPTGKPFRAKLRLKEGKAEVFFPNVYLDNSCRCPACGGRIKATQKGWGCENWWNHDNKCEVFIARKVSGRDITENEVKRFFSGKHDILMDFIAPKSGFKYDSILTRQDNRVVFTSVLCQCPKCGGNVMIGRSSFHCENSRERNEQGKNLCDFSIPRIFHNHRMKYDEVMQLIQEGHTDDIRFHTLEGYAFVSRLIMSEDKYVHFDTRKPLKDTLVDNGEEEK